MPLDQSAGPGEEPGRNADRLLLDALPPEFGRFLRGAIDLHVHGQPDLTPALMNRGDDLAVARLAKAYGMRGWVLKSHLWQTMDRARLLTEQLGEGFTVYGSITLNPPSGGISAMSVELAAAYGARVVFLPTWGAGADVARGGYIIELLTGIAPATFPAWLGAAREPLLDGSGRLIPRLAEVVRVCAELGLTLATGHLGIDESTAVVEAAAEQGGRVILTHPSHFTDDVERLRALAELGAFIEFTGAPTIHPHGKERVRDIHALIQALGVDRVVLSSDIFSRWVPPEPECLRTFAEQLFFLGVTAEQLHRMLVENPHAALGLPAPAEEAAPQEPAR